VRLAAQRAIALLDAAPVQGGAMPVVLAAEAGGTFVHEAVGHALEADAILEGMSWLEDRIGEQVASEKISVADDPTLAMKNGSFPVDDEGVRGQRVLCIDRGVLVDYLYDRRTGLMLDARSNGKGRRESFRDRPVVRMSNTMILPSTDDPAAIVEDTDRGLYVVRMGGGEVDTLTGNFVFEVNEAYRIEHGQLGELVRGATLTGSAEEVLRSIDRVGSDLGFGIGVCGKDGQDVPISDAEPTIRVPSLVVGGS
jgi:TldD protein